MSDEFPGENLFDEELFPTFALAAFLVDFPPVTETRIGQIYIKHIIPLKKHNRKSFSLLYFSYHIKYWKSQIREVEENMFINLSQSLINNDWNYHCYYQAPLMIL